MKYLLAIGSNVRPNLNIRWVLCQMLDAFDGVEVGRFFCSQANGMESRHLFWNGAVLIEAHSELQALKEQLCRWEVESGRDRTHPKCSLRDRTLDIDIVWSDQDGWYVSPDNIARVAYLAGPIASLMPVIFPRQESLAPVYFSFHQRILGGRPIRLK